jgi:glycosyltransferase involved in cell wall biosynthesis
MPLVMLESFATQRLFLATPVGGISEVLSNIDKRLLIKDLSPEVVARRVSSLLKINKFQKEKILDKEHKFVNDLSWQKVAEKIYLELSLK